jgi:hypothetical protein
MTEIAMARMTEESSGKHDRPELSGIEPAHNVDAPGLEQSADRKDRDDRRNRETQYGTVARDKNLAGRKAQEKTRAWMKSPV